MKYATTAAAPAAITEFSTNQERKGLLRSPLLRDLAPELRQSLSQMAILRTLRKGEYLFFDGEPIHHFHYLGSGRIKEYYPACDGEQCLRHIALPGHYLSLHQLLSGKPHYSYSAVAISASRCWSWPIDFFLDLMHREPTVSVQVVRLLSENVEHSCRHNCLCRKSRALAKVAGYLLSKSRMMTRQARLMGSMAPSVRIDLRPLELAAAEICLARETFSRALSCLDDRGLIQVVYGVVEILDEEGLKEISAVG
nr:Crp/Fnr family transcriptional regulator [uncultured Desulfobulbus sp.]